MAAISLGDFVRAISRVIILEPGRASNSFARATQRHVEPSHYSLACLGCPAMLA